MSSKKLKNEIFRICADAFEFSDEGLSKPELIELVEIELNRSGEAEKNMLFWFHTAISKTVDDFHDSERQNPAVRSQLELNGITVPAMLTFYDRNGGFKRIRCTKAELHHHADHCRILKENAIACNQEAERQAKLHLELQGRANGDPNAKISDLIDNNIKIAGVK